MIATLMLAALMVVKGILNNQCHLTNNLPLPNLSVQRSN